MHCRCIFVKHGKVVQIFIATAAGRGNEFKFNIKNRISGTEIFGATCKGQLCLKKTISPPMQ